ncbi:MAG: putative LacI family transcriptional regulator [Chloroflexi bacterium]|nr:putative LacI family transcriptional regulator [Chloroflexota bacterium]
MPSLKSVADQAGATLLATYHALSHARLVDPSLGDLVRRAAIEQGYTLRITIRDVAALAGVSVSTVSYVINANPLVNVDTRRKVEAAIEALEYRPNSTARNLKASETRMIGYAWHRVYDVVQRNQVLDRFLYEMAQAAERKGYHVLTFAPSAPHAEEGYTNLIRTNRVDGFVVSDTTYDDPRIRRLQELHVPFACFGRSNAAWDFPYADDDGPRGVGLVVQHLLAQGHTHIAMLGWPEGAVVGDLRVHGFHEALQAAGLNIHPGSLVRTLNDVPHAAKAAEHVLSLSPSPTAIICATDIIAIGVRMYLERSGLRMGADVAVASYDDTPVAEALGLTSVHQHIEVIARAVTDLLIGEIQGTPALERHVLVEPSLIVRASSGVGSQMPFWQPEG